MQPTHPAPSTQHPTHRLPVVGWETGKHNLCETRRIESASSPVTTEAFDTRSILFERVGITEATTCAVNIVNTSADTKRTSCSYYLLTRRRRRPF
jgi:hypothetical protein